MSASAPACRDAWNNFNFILGRGILYPPGEAKADFLIEYIER